MVFGFLLVVFKDYLLSSKDWILLLPSSILARTYFDEIDKTQELRAKIFELIKPEPIRQTLIEEDETEILNESFVWKEI